MPGLSASRAANIVLMEGVDGVAQCAARSMLRDIDPLNLMAMTRMGCVPSRCGGQLKIELTHLHLKWLALAPMDIPVSDD